MVILASDIGSTTTKLVAFELEGGHLRELGSVQEPTTVEAPHSDVCVGLFRALQRLGELIGMELSGPGGISVPYFTTSSAGGGLQVMVVGYTQADSCRIARVAAYSAGAVISGAFAMDSERNRLELMDRMSRPNPDLVLMAGGTEGGALSGVVTMAHMLNHAKPRSKYGEGGLPLLYCGNSVAEKYVREALDDHFTMSVTENVIPGNHRLNLTPAVSSVQRIFMEHVMKKAPGYPRVTEMVDAPVKPTPLGVSGILKSLVNSRGSDLILVDMGGATTDIFSSVRGEISRTVAGNIGMSYSMSNTIAETGMPDVLRHIPGAGEEDVRRWVYGKSLFPSVVPESDNCEAVENAVAVEGLRIAWQKHLETVYDPGRPSLKELFSLRRHSRINHRLETLAGKRFSLHQTETLIGAGGIFSHSSDTRVAWMLAEAFRPAGVTTLYLDTRFHSPHMGVLLSKHPEAALKYYSESCLKPVCRVLSPAWSTTGVFARVETPGGSKTVFTGDWLYLPSTEGCTLKVFGPSMEIPGNICNGLPLLIDCRRGGTPLPMDFNREFSLDTTGIRPPLRVAGGPKEELSTFSLSLPFDGMIQVKRDDEVKAGDCLGRITELPPRQFVLDIVNTRICLGEVPPEEVFSSITVAPGDTVNTGDRVFHYKSGNYYAEVKSPVHGSVTRVLPPGVIMIQEDMTHDDKPHLVQVAKKMGVSPGKMRRYMTVEVGDFVYETQVLCIDPPASVCLSPCHGFVTDINYRKGTVTVRYDMSPIRIESPLPGTVAETDGRRTVTVQSRCMRLQGVLGFGSTLRGSIAVSMDTAEEGDILITPGPVGSGELDLAREKGIKALVAPSIPAGELVRWLGREPGLFITGNEETPLTLLILQGIGESVLTPDTWEALKELSGRQGAVLPATKVRAGTLRPFLAVTMETDRSGVRSY